MGSRGTASELKVAFVGDSGVNPNAVAVLRLILDEQADAVLHQGDLWYGDQSMPQSAFDWEAQLDSVLGPDFPYFSSIGNHDVQIWSAYQPLLQARIDSVEGADCTSAPGELGIKSACTFNGLTFLLLGAGTVGTGYDEYIQTQLASYDSIWRVCSWHKNQTEMQVGGKSSEVGWGPYDACREGGAFVATAHEHSYSRTRTLSNMSTRTIDPVRPEPGLLGVGQGHSFAFVSGLGGKSIRDQERCLPVSFPYGCAGEWASIYTSNQGADHGVLFIEFNVDGDPRKASGYFKNVSGEIIDEFVIYSEN